MILFNEAKAAVEKLEDDIDNIEEPLATNEGYEPDEAGMSEIMIETAEHWGVITEAIYYADMYELNESFTNPNADITLIQEASIQGMFENVKKFFIKLWAKIKEYFANFITKLNSWILNEKSFIEKYKTQFTKAVPKKFEKKGTNWCDFHSMLSKLASITSDATAGGAVKVADSYAKTLSSTASNSDKISDIREQLEKAGDTFRGALLGATKNISKSEFKRALRFTLRNGGRFTDSAPDEFKYTHSNLNKDKIIKELTSAKETKEAISKMQESMQKLFKSILEKINDHEKDIKTARSGAKADEKDSHTEKLTIYGLVHKLYKDEAGSASAFCGSLTSALRERNGEYKALVVSVIASVRPNTGKGLKESADIDPEDIADVDDIDTKEKDMSEGTDVISAFLRTRGFN